MRYWMYASWAEDYNDQFEMLKNHGYLVGSFINPEAVKKVLGKGTSDYSSDEESYEKTLEMIRKQSKEEIKKKEEEEKSKKRRKRKKQVS